MASPPLPAATTDELTVVLADDEPLAREGLRLTLAGMPGVRLLAQAPDAEAALAAVEAHRPDLLLLDIQMPGMTGMELARRLERSSPPEIVFVTAFQDYAPEAFDVEAADFVLKPVDPGRLREAIARARRRKAMRQRLSAEAQIPAEPAGDATANGHLREFWAPSRGGATRVTVANIEWIEAARDYVLLHTSLRTHIYRTTMAKLEAVLDPKTMLRVHRSAFVNAAHVTTVLQLRHGKYALKLASGAEVRVGRLYTSSVLSQLVS
jgi:two-component system LytT family response regulator